MQDDLRSTIGAHKGKVAGGLAGLFVALLILLFGFWGFLFIIFCVVVGIFIGWRLEEGGNLGDLAERFWPYRSRLK